MIDTPHRKPRERIIDWLRRSFPSEKWTYEPYGFNSGDYVTASKWTAGYRSCLAPKYDGDDETCESRFYLYRPNLPTEQLYP